MDWLITFVAALALLVLLVTVFVLAPLFAELSTGGPQSVLIVRA